MGSPSPECQPMLGAGAVGVARPLRNARVLACAQGMHSQYTTFGFKRAFPSARAARPCGYADRPSPGADVGGVSPVPAQMWAGASPVPAQMWLRRTLQQCAPEVADDDRLRPPLDSRSSAATRCSHDTARLQHVATRCNTLPGWQNAPPTQRPRKHQCCPPGAPLRASACVRTGVRVCERAQRMHMLARVWERGRGLCSAAHGAAPLPKRSAHDPAGVRAVRKQRRGQRQTRKRSTGAAAAAAAAAAALPDVRVTCAGFSALERRLQAALTHSARPPAAEHTASDARGRQAWLGHTGRCYSKATGPAASGGRGSARWVVNGNGP